MQKHHGTAKYSERQPAIIRYSEIHVEPQWDLRNRQRQQVTIGEVESHAATPWHWERPSELASNNERHVSTKWDLRDSEKRSETMKDS